MLHRYRLGIDPFIKLKKPGPCRSLLNERHKLGSQIEGLEPHAVLTQTKFLGVKVIRAHELNIIGIIFGKIRQNAPLERADMTKHHANPSNSLQSTSEITLIVFSDIPKFERATMFDHQMCL